MSEVYHSLQLARSYGYLTDAEVFALIVLSRSLPEHSMVVNIGAGSGTSSLALAEAERSHQLFSVDISTGGPNGGLENERLAFEGAGRHYQIPRQILGCSWDIGPYWGLGPIDLVFVDAGHLKHEIENDILAWWPHLKSGGIMVFHDYQRPEWSDVKPAVEALIERSGATRLFVVDTLCAVRKA